MDLQAESNFVARDETSSNRKLRGILIHYKKFSIKSFHPCEDLSTLGGSKLFYPRKNHTDMANRYCSNYGTTLQ